MRPSERETTNIDFLGGAFLSIPQDLLKQYSALELGPQELLIILQILSSMQIERRDFIPPHELAQSCKMTPHEVSEMIGSLITRGLLVIGERLEENGTRSNYFDLKPLWVRLRGRDPLESKTREWRQDPVSLFEEEFGRPLSGLECEQIKQWSERDGLPDWLVIEALREAVLANKYSFKYIDRILFDWQRNRIRTRQELETYRQSYRERAKAREEVATTTQRKATSSRSSIKSTKPNATSSTERDERYSAFYDLFPDN